MSASGDPGGPAGAEGRRPPDRAGTVRRDALLQRLASLPDDVSVVRLVAPPGYGKTTLLGQWEAWGGRRFAWVSLDDTDNDPVRLLRHMVESLDGIEPVDDPVLSSATWRGVSPRGVLLPRLLTWLEGRSHGGVLVLDDLHRLHDPIGRAVIAVLATRLPAGWRLAVSSRTAAAWDLGPWRIQRRTAELGAEDLAFGAEETGRLLAGMGVKARGDELERLVRRTEGWPAGIYLTALSMRDRRARRAPADAADGVAALADYFRENVLDRQDDETVRFLIRTAVLERMSGPLCDAVLATSASAVRLREIASSNLFVVPQDQRDEWYRYHHLFADMLLSELRLREPDEEAVLHRRAAAWFAERGLPEEAINHALAGGDDVTAARLVTMSTQTFINTGRIATVRRWIEALGEEGAGAYPPLAVMATWVWAFEGDVAKARHSLRIAEGASFSGAPADGSASLESGIRIIRAAMAPHGLDQMLFDAQRAVELEPPGSPWHPLATWALGSAQLLQGDPGPAAKAFERTAHLGRKGQAGAVTVALAQLALLAAEDGDWPTAEAHAAAAQELIRATHLQDHLPSMLSYAASAVVAAHAQDRPAALRHIANALRLSSGGPRQVAFPWVTAQVAIVVGRVLLDLNDVPAARLRVKEAWALLAPLPTPGVLRDQLQRLTDDIARRRDAAGGQSVMTLTQAELRVLHLLPTHLSLAEIGRELAVSRNTVKTQVASVHRKLQASTRAHAVQQARELGLLRS